ncbi:GNAT family N-acetyltransferase [Candidatus Pelagibacter sp.]|nr:GNAT family N-acetyltransferase [Candidatus Pelagibacter sp.]
MSTKVERNYLEINSLNDLKAPTFFPDDCIIEFCNPADFQINKFFYKQIGKEHRWIDRLKWTDKQWINYISDQKVKTYILKKNKDLAGYFELIFHEDKNETEIAYLGLLREYQNKKLGSFLLSSAIKSSFSKNIKRVWVHTCSLDHKNALNNYISRGMKIFKKESVSI